MSFLKYAYRRDLDEHDERLRKMGYPYVNTIKLTPFNVLRPHAHNSSNTHLIVEGELTVWNTKDLRQVGTYKAGDLIPIAANTCYRAEAGAKGGVFVEGRNDLSPTGADRSETRGLMTKTPTGDMVHNGKHPVHCTHGRCHWSYNKWFHMCAEFGEGESTNEVCNAKEQMLREKTPPR